MTSTPPPATAARAFVALVGFSFWRLLRVRQVGWVAFALLLVLTGVIAAVTHGPVGWRLENLLYRVHNPDDKTGDKPLRMGYQEYGDTRLVHYQALPDPPDAFGLKAAVFAAYRAVVHDRQLLDDFAFLRFARWTVFTLFLSFLLPLFTLAYATGAVGAERESRTLLWLTTRPLPRWAVYLAKLVAVLPWGVAVSLLAFACLGLAGGELGRRAVAVYWPGAVAGAVAFTCLFHMMGAVLSRPTVVGLVYVFFFETLVANLPGSLKQFSLNYYVRSILYAETGEAVRTVRPESLDVYAPADPTAAWWTLSAVAVGVTLLGMWLFGRQEPKEET